MFFQDIFLLSYDINQDQIVFKGGNNGLGYSGYAGL